MIFIFQKECILASFNSLIYFFSSNSCRFSDQRLKSLTHNGIAYYHAGLTPDDRNLIEQMFRSGRLPVLLSTSSLAMGVNLPAHTVIIKSTEVSPNRNLKLFNSVNFGTKTIIKKIYLNLSNIFFFKL